MYGYGLVSKCPHRGQTHQLTDTYELPLALQQQPCVSLTAELSNTLVIYLLIGVKESIGS